MWSEWKLLKKKNIQENWSLGVSWKPKFYNQNWRIASKNGFVSLFDFNLQQNCEKEKFKTNGPTGPFVAKLCASEKKSWFFKKMNIFKAVLKNKKEKIMETFLNAYYNIKHDQKYQRCRSRMVSDLPWKVPCITLVHISRPLTSMWY